MTKALTSSTVDLPLELFARREAHGPLSPLEQCYKAICTLGFNQLVDCDSAMTTGYLNEAGKSWLLPVIRQVLGHTGPLPLQVADWITLYHRARHSGLEHFSDWNVRYHSGTGHYRNLAKSSVSTAGPGHWC